MSVLIFVAPTTFAKGKGKKRCSKQKRCLAMKGTQRQRSRSFTARKKSQKRRKAKGSMQPNVQGGLGKVYGISNMFGLGSSDLYQAEYRISLTRSVQVPIGMSFYGAKGRYEDFSWSLSGQTIDSGLIYQLPVTSGLSIPIGSHLGWSQIKIGLEGQSEDEVFNIEQVLVGWNATPFTGFRLNLSRQTLVEATVGFPIHDVEVRGAEKSKSSDDGDESESSSPERTPARYMVSLGIKI